MSAYWYYSAQSSALERNQYYKLQHLADTISQKIIYAHMQGLKLSLPELDTNVHIALISTNKEITYGSLIQTSLPTQAEYLTEGTYNILVSDAPQQHLDTEYVVVYSDALYSHIQTLKQNVLLTLFVSILLMIILATLLSRIFMKPLHQKIKQIEDFVHDTAHELNTPITALNMSVSRALSKKNVDVKTLKNISISSKQLFDIYNSLAYLSFDTKVAQEISEIEVCQTVEKSVAYYKELAESKQIDIHLTCKAFSYSIDEVKLSMLFGNLINNAIKYSHPNSRIDITCKEYSFSIKDSGIGIEKDTVSKIFERYNRETEYAGGFGIGLNIVQKIAHEYNLELNVESKLQEGSCFTVLFKS